MSVNKSINDQLQENLRGNWKTVKLIDAYSAGAGENVVTASEEVSTYGDKSISVETSDNCTVVYQVSPDGTDWFDPHTYQNGTTKETYTCNADKIDIQITRPCRYIRAVVTATAASVISLWLTARK